MTFITIRFTTVKDYFGPCDVQPKGYFAEPTYDGSQEDEHARASFRQLTNHIVWTQVHGDVKNAVKRALFTPYPNWPELYVCCRDVIRAHSELGTQWVGDLTNAKIMGEAMALMRERHGVPVPRWWLPIMNRLRGRERP